MFRYADDLGLPAAGAIAADKALHQTGAEGVDLADAAHVDGHAAALRVAQGRVDERLESRGIRSGP